MANTLEDIKTLRARTGAGMADCKKALEEADGDMDGAIEILRKKGAATAAKRADKAADEGVIATAIADDNRSAAIVEINCETDFVARNEDFSGYAAKIAAAILADNPADLDSMKGIEIDGTTIESGLNDLLAKFSERIEVRRFERLESDSGYLGDYIHGGARLGVLIELSTPSDGAEVLSRDVAMQVAAMNPSFVRRDQVSDEKLEKEREIYRDQLAGENKPPEIVERIITGRLEKYYEENVLLEQSFVKDSAQSVNDVLGESTVSRFVRYNLGEAIEEPSTAA